MIRLIDVVGGVCACCWYMVVRCDGWCCVVLSCAACDESVIVEQDAN